MGILRGVYENYHKKLLECGATREEADLAIAEARKLDEALDSMICPECKAPVTRTLDGNQAGPSLVQGAWYKYTCAACLFFMCRVESDEEAS